MQEKFKKKNNHDSKKKNNLNTDFSKGLNQFIEDQQKKISNPFQGLSEKMIFSTSKEDKKIILWDERTGGIVFSYEDESIKTYIPTSKLQVLGIYSEYIIATQENKSMFLAWKTDTVDAIFKCSPIEERVTVFKVSNDSLYLYIGTETGKVYLYELFSGNIITSFNAHVERINDLEISYDNSVLVTCSSDNMIKLFLIESILESNRSSNTSLVKFECLVGNKELLNIKLCGIPTYLVFGITKDNTLIVFDYPKLQILKKIYFNDCISSFEFTRSFNELYIHQCRRIYFLKVEEIFDKNEQSNISQESLKKVIETEKMITCFCIGSKFLLVGQEDGIIALYNLFTYKFVQNISNHKGAITNIVCVNRPISQYGLSYNINISNMIVKQLKKPNTSYSNTISISSNLVNTSLVEKHIENLLDHQENTLNFLGIQEEIKINSTKCDVNIQNEFDEKFLQKKLGEAYMLLKNK